MENIKIDQIEIERQKINQIDGALVKLLDVRFETVQAIAKIKKQLQMPIFQPGREQIVLQRVSQISKNPKSNKRIFEIIMLESKNIQEALICK